MDWNRRFEQVFASGSEASALARTQIGAGAYIMGDVISAESVELSGHITGRLVSVNGEKRAQFWSKPRVLCKASWWATM